MEDQIARAIDRNTLLMSGLQGHKQANTKVLEQANIAKDVRFSRNVVYQNILTAKDNAMFQNNIKHIYKREDTRARLKQKLESKHLQIK